MKRRHFITTGMLAATAVGTGLHTTTAWAADDHAPVGTNNLDQVISDMTRDNSIIFGTKPNDPGKWFSAVSVMGNDARGTNAPEWWREKLEDKDYADSDYWPVIQPWMLIEVAEGQNAAVNTRVRLSQIRLNVLRQSTGRWERVQTTTISGETFDGDAINPIPDTSDPKYIVGNAVDIVPPHKRTMTYHGWGELQWWDTWDIRAVHVSVDARLVVNDRSKPDDRSKAAYVLQVGGDYKPSGVENPRDDPKMHLGNGQYYYPGIGNSRNRRIYREWRTYNFCTLLEAKRNEPGGGISIAELRSNPPSLH